jgi:hypothetical protein
LPHRLRVRKKDVDGVELLFLQGVIPLARFAAGSEFDLLELPAPQINELANVGGWEVLQGQILPLIRLITDASPSLIQI